MAAGPLPIDDRQCRCGRVPDHHHVSGGPSIDPDYVGLRLMGVGDRSNVPEQHRRAIHDLDGQLIEVGNPGRAHVDVDVVLEMAHPRGSRRNDYVRGGERVA